MRDLLNICETYISELKGYRGSDEFKGVQNMDAKFKKTGNATVDGYARHKVLYDYMQGLESKGYTALGAGGYGCVFTHPGLDYAIKIFEGDPAYLSYVKYVLAHQNNPHFPKFRGKFVRLQDSYYAVRLELLQPLDLQLKREVASALYAVGDRPLYPEDLDDYKGLLAEYPDMLNAMEGIIQVCKTANTRLDINGASNIMGRGGVPVFTDPVAERSNSDV